jgi:hypothetical protein
LSVKPVLAGTALAEEPVESVKRGDLDIRYWLSTGEIKSTHNAQSLDPTLGNPTSVLLYENLGANVLELGAWARSQGIKVEFEMRREGGAEVIYVLLKAR